MVTIQRDVQPKRVSLIPALQQQVEQAIKRRDHWNKTPLQTKPPRKETSLYDGIIDPGKITVSRQLANNHFLSETAGSKAPLTLEQIKKELDLIRLDLLIYPTGVMPAANNAQNIYNHGISHYDHGWLRDWALCALAMGSLGVPETEQALLGMGNYLNEPSQRKRLTDFLWDQNPPKKYIHAKDEDIVDIRGWINGKGYLSRSQSSWDPRQIDALGMAVYVPMYLANKGKLDLQKLDTEINKGNSQDSIYSVILKYLNKIDYCRAPQTGTWEREQLPGRAECISSCLAAGIETRKLLKSHGLDYINVSGLEHELDNFIDYGKRFLEQNRIFANGSPAIETDSEQVDAALLFTLIVNPELTAKQKYSVLQTVYKLIGEFAFQRTPGDHYMAENHSQNAYGHGRFSHYGARPAEWPMLEALAAKFAYDQYIESGGKDEKAFLVADKHHKRVDITFAKQNYVYHRFDGRRIEIPEKATPELIHLNNGTPMPNENCNLLMAIASFGMMESSAIEATTLWEINHSKKAA